MILPPETTRTSRSRGKGGLGLRTKLFVAFGAVAGLTVLASAIAFVSYDEVGRALGGIAGENLPAMTASVRLARSSAEIVSIAPALLAAHDMKEHDATLATLQADQKSLQQAIDAIASTANRDQTIGALRGAAGQMAANLTGLAADVQRRLELDGQITALAAQVRATHKAIEAALAPLVDDASFDLVTGLQNAAGTKDPAATQQHLSDLANKQVVALQAMSDLRADSNLVLGLLTEGAAVPSKDLFPPLLDRFNAAASHLEKSLGALGDDKSAAALRQPVDALLQDGRGDKSIFALRSAELDAAAAGETAIAANHRLAGTLEDAVSQLVVHNETAARTAATTTDAAIARGRVLLISVAIASLLVALVIGAFYIGRGVARRLGALRNSMAAIAGGDFDAPIPAGGSDEIAEMASALSVFRDTGRAAREAEAAAATERSRMEEQRRAELLSLADAFEVTVKSVVDTVSGAASEMQEAAASLARTADHSNRQASAVAAASTEASTNVQTVAAAAEELSSSTAEIGRQVAESAEVAARAVAETDRTNATVKGLAEAAHRIQDVVSLINNIASQTNLLALNATIEAARAGEAGKGFAVVASEVKALATQTAKATDDIAAQVGAIQGATRDAIDAMSKISKTISRINEIATAAASAVEEQNATTREIARNVQHAAEGTHSVSVNIAGVTEAVGETGSAANIVLGSAAELAGQARKLSDEVDRFLGGVRAR
ncbi:MAG TPA: methyl-accepting chemotaxis protein [Stellaceae bacterium]|nr:methyl-accepting chemotaxis protein [Stellaceae bacterium]